MSHLALTVRVGWGTTAQGLCLSMTKAALWKQDGTWNAISGAAAKLCGSKSSTSLHSTKHPLTIPPWDETSWHERCWQVSPKPRCGSLPVHILIHQVKWDLRMATAPRAPCNSTFLQFAFEKQISAQSFPGKPEPTDWELGWWTQYPIGSYAKCPELQFRAQL